jgi:hypothetical protein
MNWVSHLTHIFYYALFENPAFSLVHIRVTFYAIIPQYVTFLIQN